MCAQQPGSGQFMSHLNALHTMLYFSQVHLNRPISVPSTSRSYHVIYFIQAPRLNFVSISHAP
jgi:hypothetical protein